MKAENTNRAAAILAAAWRENRAIEPLPEDIRPKTPAEAYRIQAATMKVIGVEVAGWKVGATGTVARKLLKARGPFAGAILAGRVHGTGAEIKSDAYPMRGLEGEIAFRLGKDLKPRAKPYGMAEVKRAIATVHPAIEIVSSRWSLWPGVGLPSLIADHGSNAALVLGRAFADAEMDLDGLPVSMTVDGQEVGKGVGADVIGGPHASLLWLANLLRRGPGLKAGQIVSTGTCTGLFKAPARSKVAARYGGKVRVELTFL